MKPMLRMEIVSNNIQFFVTVALVTLVVACDFTPRLHKDILHAQNLIAMQDYQTAINRYEDILDRNPNDEIKVKIHYQIGELYSINLNQNVKALEHYEKVKEYSEEPLWLVKAQERIGEINFSYLRNNEAAARAYTRLLAFNPKLRRFDFYQYRLALCLLGMKNYSEAETLLREMEANPNHEYHIRSIYELGLSYFYQEKWNEAIEIWRGYIKREKRTEYVVQAKFLMANAYETMEDLKAAYNMYYSILGKYPNTEVIKNRLEAIYSRRVARKR